MLRRRRLGAGAALLCGLLFVLAGCGSGPANDMASTFAPRPTTGLARYLEPPPKGSTAGTSEWAQTYAPTTKQFVDNFYPETQRKQVTATLRSQGLVDIAHALWLTGPRTQVEIVLLQFRNTAGAGDRLAATVGPNYTDSGQTSYRLTGRGSPVVFEQVKANSRGYIGANAYALVGTTVVEVFTFSPGVVDRAFDNDLVRAQIARLP